MAEITIAQAKAILSKIDIAINSALAHEVADVAVRAVQKAATNNVYEAYSGPMAMFRRKEHGGLIDPKNIMTIAEGNVLTVDNITGLQNLWSDDDSSLLTPIVESGLKDYYQPFPRPFMEYAGELMLTTDEFSAEKALKLGLARQGIELENGITFTVE